MRPHAPPKLRVLRDRSGIEQDPNVVLERLPVAVGIGDPTAGEELREDLRPRRVEVREDALVERRAAGERKDLGQEVAEPVADLHRPVRAGDADVDVEAEAVVPPDDVAKDLVVPAVVRRVDDPLLLPWAPRVRPRAAEND